MRLFAAAPTRFFLCAISMTLVLTAPWCRAAQSAKTAASQFFLADEWALHSSMLSMSGAVERTEDAQQSTAVVQKSIEEWNRQAVLLSSKGRYAAAISYWRRCLALKSDPRIETSLAIALYQNGSAQEATDRLQRVLEGSPARKDTHFALGSIYAHEKRYRDAATEYAKAFQLEPSDLEPLVAETNALISAEAYSDALEPAEECVRRRPSDWKVHLLLGGIQTELGHYKEAQSNLRFVLALQPDNAVALYEMGRALAVEEDFDAAVSMLDRALTLDPSNTAAAATLGRVLRRLGQNDRSGKILQMIGDRKRQELQHSQQSSLISQANDLLKQNKGTEAAEIYKQVLVNDPQNVEAEYNLGLAFRALKDVAGERQALERAIELNPQLAAAKLQMGYLEEATGDTESARKWYQSAIQANPQLAEAKDALAVLTVQTGDVKASINLLHQALEDDPTYLQAYLDLATVLGRNGALPEAVATISQAMKFAPDDPSFLISAASAMSKIGEDDEALKLAQQATRDFPQSLNARVELVTALALLYRLPAAFQIANQAVQLFPNSADALFTRGRVLYFLRRNEEAEADFLAAARVDSQFALPLFFSGLIEMQKGNFVIAADHFADAARLQPANSMVWYQLGVALDHASRPQPAVQALRQALSVDSDDLLTLEELEHALEPIDKNEAEQIEGKIRSVERLAQLGSPAEVEVAKATAFMKADDWHSAMAVLNNGLESCDSCAGRPKLLAEFGLVQARSGDLNGGRQSVLAASRLNPGDTMLKKLLSTLDRALLHNEGSPIEDR